MKPARLVKGFCITIGNVGQISEFEMMTRRTFATALLSLWVVTTAPLAAHEMFRFVGTITKLVKVEAKRDVMTVTFKEKQEERTVDIVIIAGTEVTRDGKPVPKSDLKVGMSIVVDALGDDESNLDAWEIKIVPAPSK